MSVAEPLSVQINGELRRVSAGGSIATMLAELGIDHRKVAVERNREIVPRATLDEVKITDGDAFEVVHFVGGG